MRVSFLFDTLIWKDARGFVPALALGITLVSLALIGFGLKSRFDPTLRG